MERYAELRPGGGSWLNMRVVYIAPHVFEKFEKEDKFRHIILQR